MKAEARSEGIPGTGKSSSVLGVLLTPPPPWPECRPALRLNSPTGEVSALAPLQQVLSVVGIENGCPVLHLGPVSTPCSIMPRGTLLDIPSAQCTV